jgi:hypothetical protein
MSEQCGLPVGLLEKFGRGEAMPTALGVMQLVHFSPDRPEAEQGEPTFNDPWQDSAYNAVLELAVGKVLADARSEAEDQIFEDLCAKLEAAIGEGEPE